MAYLISQKFNEKAFTYFGKKNLAFKGHVVKNIAQMNSKVEFNYLDHLKNRSLHLASSWTDFVKGNLFLLKQPMRLINVYSSYVVGNGALYLLGKQPVGLLAATGIFFSSKVFAVLADLSIELVKDIDEKADV